MATITYPFRRFGWWLRTPEVVCVRKSCARPRVGFSHFCRIHTDEILRTRFNCAEGRHQWCHKPYAADPSHYCHICQIKREDQRQADV